MIPMVAVLLLIGSAVGISETQLKPSSDSGNLEISEPESLGFFDLLPQFSFYDVQDNYEPNTEQTVTVKVDIQESFNLQDGTYVTSMYRCADKTCETPPPLDSPSGDSCSESEWSPDYDDCIMQKEGSWDVDREFDTSRKIGWDTTFTVPDKEAQYILTGYVYTTEDGWNRVTSLAEHKFTVGNYTAEEPSPTPPSPDPEKPNFVNQVQNFIGEWVSKIVESVQGVV